MTLLVGRPLETEEYVHHIDEDKRNNDPQNLQILDPVTHGRLHHLRYALTKTCVVCGTPYTPHKTKRKTQQACSEPCKLKLIGLHQPNRKLTDGEVVSIRRRRAAGEKLASLAREFGVSVSLVCQISKGTSRAGAIA